MKFVDKVERSLEEVNIKRTVMGNCCIQSVVSPKRRIMTNWDSLFSTQRQGDESEVAYDSDFSSNPRSHR